MYKISVIVPVYNAGKYIEKCVNSILCQGFDSLEIILVDDGSTDDSPELVDRLAAEHDNITAVHQENSKQGAARNVGLRMAKGEYILFVDSDDYLIGDSLQEMYDLCCDNQLDMLGSNAVCLNEKGEQVEESMAFICEEDVIFSGKDYVARYGYKVQPMVFLYLFSKAFLEENGLVFLERTYCEDCYFILQCVANAKRMLYHPYAHYAYAYNESSTTRAHNSKWCFDKINVGELTVSYVKSLDFPEILKSQFLKYAAYLAHSSLTLAAEQNMPAKNILKPANNRLRLISILKNDKKYYIAITFLNLHLENLYQSFFLKKLIKLKRYLFHR